MLIDFEKMETTVIPNMKGGEKQVLAKMYTDELGKLLRGVLIPGASIGLHTHEGSYEVIYILSGSPKVLYDGGMEHLFPGACHYCPKDHTHSLINDTEEDVTFLAIVPESK